MPTAKLYDRRPVCAFVRRNVGCTLRFVMRAPRRLAEEIGSPTTHAHDFVSLRRLP
jgi:hypothetical protein